LYYAIIHPKTKEKIYPDTYSDSPRVWGCSPKTHEENVAQNLVWWGKDQELKEPKKKRFLKDHGGVNIRSVWDDVGTNEDASQLLRDLFGIEKIYPNPKPTTLIEKIMRYSVYSGEIIIDFFAGSGTTGHAVINLNREDGGKRKFILVEMADYFDTVLLPRIKKVTFTPEWRTASPGALPLRKKPSATRASSRSSASNRTRMR
jgi:adenine-specific DNA-methyltransferase